VAAGVFDQVEAPLSTLVQMKKFPDYCERLERMEAEAEHDWAAKKS
jgi:hypothetical protein